jgi:hypothetical protein
MSTLVLEPGPGGQGAVVDKRRHIDAIVAARRRAAVGVPAGQVSETLEQVVKPTSQARRQAASTHPDSSRLISMAHPLTREGNFMTTSTLSPAHLSDEWIERGLSTTDVRERMGSGQSNKGVLSASQSWGDPAAKYPDMAEYASPDPGDRHVDNRLGTRRDFPGHRGDQLGGNGPGAAG